MKFHAVFYRLFVMIICFQLLPEDAMALTLLSDDDVNRIDTYIEIQLRDAHIPGAALAIVEGNQISHAKGFGSAGPDGRPVTPDTPFILGSVSKGITALAVMQLVEEGKLDLEANVQQYLPWFQTADPLESSQIRVKYLLNHSSGFSTRIGLASFNTDDSDSAIEQRVRKLQTARLIARPGTQFQYSNVNYTILGAIIQVLSGQSYEQYIQQHIFDPLHMNSSYTSKEAAKPNIATGYRYWFGQPVAAANLPYPRSEKPAGFLISSAQDMGHYLIALMNDGQFKDTRILSAEGVARLHRPEGRITWYNMGWVFEAVLGTRAFVHTGSTPAFRSIIGIFPNKQRGFILLINAGNHISGPDLREFRENMKSLVLGKTPPPIAKGSAWNPWLIGLGVLFLSQILAVLWTFGRIRRWRLSPESPSKTAWRILRNRVRRPVLINLVIAGATLVITPYILKKAMAGVLLFAPDLGWLLILNGTLALLHSTLLLVAAGVFIRRDTQDS